jgi:hypothetical protein
MRYLAQALINLTRVGVQFKVRGNTYADIIWLDEIDAIPNESDTMAERQRLIDEYDAQDYARKRESEYPPLKEFAEAYTEKEFGEDATKMDAYKIKYNKVRSDNPK